MRAEEVLREVLDEVDSSGIGEAEKSKVRQAVCRVARRNGITCFDRSEQIAFIQHLHGVMQEPRVVIKDRLMAHFDISKTTAYERISDAIGLSGKAAVCRTKEVLNIVNEMCGNRQFSDEKETV